MNEQPIDLAVYSELRPLLASSSSPSRWTPFSRRRPACWPSCATPAPTAIAERFRRVAHSLKSNANTFGAVSLGAQARELELKGLDAEPDRDEAALAALEVEHARTAAALKALRNA